MMMNHLGKLIRRTAAGHRTRGLFFPPQTAVNMRWFASAAPSKLSDAQRVEQRKRIQQWKMVHDRDAIRRLFKFKDFNQAWKFMSIIANKAEEMGHHPEWFNVYDTVDVTLSTHDVGGLSMKDIEMAVAMDQAAEECGAIQ